MCNKNFSAASLRLYAITDRGGLAAEPFLRKVEAALRGGVTLLQLREKDLGDDAFLREALAVKELCRRYGVPLIINDNVTVALKAGADGVHVGAEDAPVSEIREQTGAGFIIGATAKTVAQAQKAEADGADYLGVGAVFPSPTKRNAIRVTGEQLKAITESVSLPAVAIGGVSADNIAELAPYHLSGVAVVSAIFAAKDTESAAKELNDITKRLF